MATVMVRDEAIDHEVAAIRNASTSGRRFTHTSAALETYAKSALSAYEASNGPTLAVAMRMLKTELAAIAIADDRMLRALGVEI
jgi:hypothetical protein